MRGPRDRNRPDGPEAACEVARRRASGGVGEARGHDPTTVSESEISWKKFQFGVSFEEISRRWCYTRVIYRLFR